MPFSRRVSKRAIFWVPLILMLLFAAASLIHLNRTAGIIRHMEKEHHPWSGGPGKYDHVADFLQGRMGKLGHPLPSNHPLLVWIRLAGYRCDGFNLNNRYGSDELDLLSASTFDDLDFLQLGGSDMTAGKLRQIGPKPRCRFLDLENCREVDADAMAVIARNFPSLEALNLKGTSVRAEGFAALRHLKGDQLVLGLRHVTPFALEDLDALVAACPQLTYINCPRLTDDDLVPLYAASQLWGIDLRDCDIEGQIGQELHHFPELRWLYFGGVQPNSRRDVDLIASGEPVPSLTRLALSNCEISPLQLEGIVRRFPHLEELWIDKTRLDASSLSALSHLKKLTQLNLYKADLGEISSKIRIDLPLDTLNIDPDNKATLDFGPGIKKVTTDAVYAYDWFPASDYHFEDF